MNAVAFAYGRSAGDVVFDPSLPIEDVQAVIHSGALGYYRSIDLLGRSAMSVLRFHTRRGLLEGTDTRVYRSGLADLRVQISANLIGAPGMNLRQFAEYRRNTSVWASLAVLAPTGQYDPAKLINLGANRWGFNRR